MTLRAGNDAMTRSTGVLRRCETLFGLSMKQSQPGNLSASYPSGILLPRKARDFMNLVESQSVEPLMLSYLAVSHGEYRALAEGIVVSLRCISLLLARAYILIIYKK